MPSLALHAPLRTTTTSSTEPPNPLPPLLHTPLGLALLEIQGSLNLPGLRTGVYADAVVDLTDEDAFTAGVEAGAEVEGIGAGAGNGDGDGSGLGNGNGQEKTRRQIGRLEFPLLETGVEEGVTEGVWMKKVYLFIGENQRLTGEIKKLPKAVGVVRRARNRSTGGGNGGVGDGEEGPAQEGRKGVELEIVEVVKWKVFFGSRPEFV